MQQLQIHQSKSNTTLVVFQNSYCLFVFLLIFSDGEIAELLARLHSLGFNEDQINLHFLQKSKGNFDKCVKKLWKRQHKQQWSGCKRWNH